MECPDSLPYCGIWGIKKSGREDLNLRPPAPKAGKLSLPNFSFLKIILDRTTLFRYLWCYAVGRFLTGFSENKFVIGT